VPIAGYDPIPDGAILDLATLPTRNLNVLARTSPALVGSVRFALDDDPNFRTESTAPYALAGDCGDGCYHAWTPSSGTHTLTATPFGEASAGGAAGPALAIRFTVVDEPPTGPRAAALVSRASGKCATVLDGASGVGAVIGIEPCDGRAAQRFMLPAPGTSGAIHAAGGALCVDAASGYGNDGDAILLWSCHGGANQQWALGPDGLLRGIGGKCMDVSGGHTADRTPLILWSCHAGSNQQWDAGRAAAGRD
jgi:hypothetical protein